jgi:hypothetical protein
MKACRKNGPRDGLRFQLVHLPVAGWEEEEGVRSEILCLISSPDSLSTYN